MAAPISSLGSAGEAPRFRAIDPAMNDFVEKLNSAMALLESCIIRPGAGYDFNRTGGGTSFTVPRPPPRIDLEPHPYKAEKRLKPQTKDEYEASIYTYSFVMKDANDYAQVGQTKVNGQNLFNLTGSAQPGKRWFRLAPFDLIWIEWLATDNSYNIKSLGNGDSWADPRTIVERGPGGAQLAWRLPIASSQEEADKPPVLIQHLFHNLLEGYDCLSGQSARMPITQDVAPYIPAMP